MSYRSLKRVLGETSLERKCRILFGISLLILIATAFFYAARRAEKLVTEGPRRTGESFIREKLASYHHARAWWTSSDPKPKREEDIAMAQQFQDSFISNFDSTILVLDERGVAAATVAAESARIGDARSTLDDGRLSAVNRLAEQFGMRVGMRVGNRVGRKVGDCDTGACVLIGLAQTTIAAPE